MAPDRASRDARWSGRNPGNESDVSVTDGVQTARAISFFSVANGKVTRLVEFWPEPYAAPADRAHLVEPMD